MKPGALIIGTVASVVLLAAAAVLYMKSNASGEQDYRAAINAVQNIQRLSSDWSIEIIRVKSDPLADFDSLASFIPRMARLKQGLNQTARGIPGLPDRLANDINAYVSAVDAKEERVERFKTGYAVVRNSARYLPLAASNVVSVAQDSQDQALAQEISSLVQNVERHLVTPTEASQTRLLDEMESLREKSVSYPPALANGIANLLSHAEVLVTKQGPTEVLFREATSQTISNMTDDLVGSLQFALGRTSVETAQYDRGLLAVIVLLALFWILLALQQRRRSGAPLPAAAAVEAPPAGLATTAGKADAPKPAPDDPPAAPQPALQPAPDDPPAAPQPAPGAAAVPSPGVSPPTPPAPEAEPDLGVSIARAFTINCAARTLASSAEQITARMDYLRQTQQHLQNELENSNGVGSLYNGADLDEEMAALAAIAANVHQETAALSELSRRLESISASPEDEISRSMTNINSCIDDVVGACDSPRSATITKRLGEVPEILASQVECRLFLSELIDNSIHAVEGMDERKGAIRIDTAFKDDEILITIIDNGTGIAAERRMNIFKPFYSSRKGAMGIGLSLAGHLVKKYDGVIKINSLPGQGTVARISMPAGVPSP